MTQQHYQEFNDVALTPLPAGKRKVNDSRHAFQTLYDHGPVVEVRDMNQKGLLIITWYMHDHLHFSNPLKLPDVAITHLGTLLSTLIGLNEIEDSDVRYLDNIAVS